MKPLRPALAFAAPLLLAAGLHASPGQAEQPPVITFGRSLNIEGTPLRLSRSFAAPGLQLGALAIRPSGLPLRANWISSGFGLRLHPFGGGTKFHGGLDFAAPTGTTVHATAPGIVTLAGWYGNYGLCVVIDHGAGTSTLFGHMSAIAATSGEQVQAGQTIGRVGSTGRSTGPHLHYEVRLGGRPVDPRSYL